MYTRETLEKLRQEQKRASEISGLLIYTFGILLIGASFIIRRHEILMGFVLFIALFAMWHIFFTGMFNLKVRIIIITVVEALCVLAYSTQVEAFVNVAIPIAVVEVLHIIYKEMVCVYIDMVTTALVAAKKVYTHYIEKGFDGDFTIMLIEIASLVLLHYVCIYLIKLWKANDATTDNIVESLYAAEDAKNDFMANMSHELRTPINSVLGTTSILLDHDLSEQDKDYLFAVEESGQRLLGVVNDVMDYTMLESGTLPLNENPYIITSVINDTANYVIGKNKNNNVNVFFDVDPTIPASLFGDCEKITRVIFCLMDNAIKFTMAGTIMLKVSYRKVSYGINLCINVTDTGIGMDERALQSLREGLYMVDAKSARRHEGAGFGLTVVDGMLSLMNGFLLIDSELGKGSSFTAIIPQKVLNSSPSIVIDYNESKKIIAYTNPETLSIKAMREEYIHAVQDMADKLGVSITFTRTKAELSSLIGYNNYSHLVISEESYFDDKSYFDEISNKFHIILISKASNKAEVPAEFRRLYQPFYAYYFEQILSHDKNVELQELRSHTKKFVTKNARVMVVDDNKTNLKVVEGLLKKYKVSTILCRSGAEALEKCKDKDYDFIFMDHMMPDMDGIETMKKIREIPDIFFMNVPIIVLTANAVGGAREMFLGEGFNDFISKPINRRELERVLLSYLPGESIEYITEEQTAPKESQKATTKDDGTDVIDLNADGEDKKLDFIKKDAKLIDKKLGLDMLNNDEDLYNEAVKSYLNDVKKYKLELPDYYAKSDYDNYAIIVHAIKSTSKMIGAEALSEEAYKLEEAAKEKDKEYIAKNHDSFMELFNQVAAILDR